MPSFARSTSVSSESASGSDGVHGHTTSASSAGSSVHVGSDDYVAKSFPDYSEKPLDEQLEPIAVVGIGEYPPLRRETSD